MIAMTRKKNHSQSWLSWAGICCSGCRISNKTLGGVTSKKEWRRWESSSSSRFSFSSWLLSRNNLWSWFLLKLCFHSQELAFIQLNPGHLPDGITSPQQWHVRSRPSGLKPGKNAKRPFLFTIFDKSKLDYFLSFKKDLEYWEIDELIIEPCCALKYYPGILVVQGVPEKMVHSDF